MLSHENKCRSDTETKLLHILMNKYRYKCGIKTLNVACAKVMAHYIFFSKLNSAINRNYALKLPKQMVYLILFCLGVCTSFQV